MPPRTSKKELADKITLLTYDLDAQAQMLHLNNRVNLGDLEEYKQTVIEKFVYGEILYNRSHKLRAILNILFH